MSYVAIWLQACLHWRCAHFQTSSWNDTIFVVDWDLLDKLCGLANKWSKGFIFSGKIWWKLFSCNKACSKYHTGGTTTPKYTQPGRLVHVLFCRCEKGLLNFLSEIIRPRPHVSGDFCIRKFFYADTKIPASTRSVYESYTTVHTYPIRIRTSQRISQQSMENLARKKTGSDTVTSVYTKIYGYEGPHVSG